MGEYTQGSEVLIRVSLTVLPAQFEDHRLASRVWVTHLELGSLEEPVSPC